MEQQQQQKKKNSHHLTRQNTSGDVSGGGVAQVLYRQCLMCGILMWIQLGLHPTVLPVSRQILRNFYHWLPLATTGSDYEFGLLHGGSEVFPTPHEPDVGS